MKYNVVIKYVENTKVVKYIGVRKNVVQQKRVKMNQEYIYV